MRKSLIIVFNEFALLKRDPMPVMLLLAMPLVVMAFLKPAFAPALQVMGYKNATGAEQVVPGVAVMFAYYVVGFSGAYFFREHIWGTWDRVRASELSNNQILFGKLAPGLIMLFMQQTVLFGFGFLVFELTAAGPVIAMVVLDAVFCLFITSFTFAIIALCRTVQQVFAMASLGSIVLGAIGGSITPIESMPDWAQNIAPLTPTYWAMKGFNSIVLDGAGLNGVKTPLAVLLGMTLVLTVVGVVRFSFTDEKTGTL